MGRNLVWYSCADRGRGRIDHATGGDEPVHHQFDGSQHSDDGDVQGRDLVCGVGYFSGDLVGSVSSDHVVLALLMVVFCMHAQGHAQKAQYLDW